MFAGRNDAPMYDTNTKTGFARARKDGYLLQDRQNIGLQHQVQSLIAAGRMLEAINAVSEAAPGTLESHPRVKFQLQCQHFVEMVSYIALSAWLDTTPDHDPIWSLLLCVMKSSVLVEGLMHSSV